MDIVPIINATTHSIMLIQPKFFFRGGDGNLYASQAARQICGGLQGADNHTHIVTSKMIKNQNLIAEKIDYLQKEEEHNRSIGGNSGS
ncbi:hypothetical protein [Oscillibacter sp.]|uniref:hypothetical protein n=1 Tax=Oscillibacter sp. TaxID=1945593 RepID=UPI002897AF97|nr:hypothetical protein [Oscillibacter sp.]